jgi:hypothetical protein
MCVHKVLRNKQYYEKDKVYVGYKILTYEKSACERTGKYITLCANRVLEPNKWLKAKPASSDLVSRTYLYSKGFHAYMTRRQAEIEFVRRGYCRDVVIKKVYLRDIVCSGENIVGEKIIVANNMMVKGRIKITKRRW